MLILLLVAFVAGLVTAVSPCVLPILPIVLATGAGGDRRRPYLVIAGLIASFSFFTLASVQIVTALHLPPSILRDVAIVVIAVFGLSLVVPALTAAFDRATARLPALGARLARAGGSGMGEVGGASLGAAGGAGGIGAAGPGGPRVGATTAPEETTTGRPSSATAGRAGIVGGLITGVGLGLVWTPCAGPILGAITSLAVTAPNSGATVALVIAYSIGAGLPLLAIAVGGRTAVSRLRLRSASRWGSRALGVVVLVTAGLMAVGADTAISAALVSDLPNWTGSLQTLERSDQVRTALSGIGAGTGAALVATPAPAAAGKSIGPLPVGMQAPEFAGLTGWLNSNPLTMAGLRGKVVLVDFWTYSCINCIRTLPYVEGWYRKYEADGLVVVGVHTPEFAFEHDAANVSAAVARFGITYPVVQDNQYLTWTAYGNLGWPGEYLVDANGHVRAASYGEGDYATTEAEIRSLLIEAGASISGGPSQVAPPPIRSDQTPEIHLGREPARGVVTESFPASPTNNAYALSGQFDEEREYAQATSAGDRIELSFNAADVYLVMAADSPVKAHVAVSGAGGAGGFATGGATEDVAADGTMTVSTARLYHLVHMPAFGHGVVTISFDAPGVRAYAFTFGSPASPTSPPVAAGSTPAASGPGAGAAPSDRQPSPGPSATGAFAATGSMSAPREYQTATPLSDGRVLVAGGQNAALVPSASAELFDPKSGEFAPTGTMTAPREYQTATPLFDGRVLVTGGDSGFGTPVASAEVYDPLTGTFERTGSMATPREYQTATAIAGGRVLVAGGWSGTGALASAELFDPATGVFSKTGSMGTPRESATATLLSDGRVLIAGGWDGTTALRSAEIYDPQTGSFSATGSMAGARAYQTATTLGDGRVLVAGGWDGTAALATAEIYDPTTRMFTQTGSMASGRMFQAAAALGDGRVLIADGEDGPGGTALASAEVYDPVIGVFRPAGAMVAARISPTATVVPNGRVLFVGGSSDTGPLASAELYVP